MLNKGQNKLPDKLPDKLLGKVPVKVPGKVPDKVPDRVLDTIREHDLIEPGDNILVGVSGGPDSVCLLHILYSFSHEMRIKLYAVHVNHMLRGEESDMDERYVKELCESLGIKLFTVSLNIRGIAEKQNISIEEAAREARYGQFNILADKIGNCKVAVAHNKNDQAETIIMNIIRGTGLDGLRGMDYKRNGIIRPLLDIERKEIEEYCREHNLKTRTDSTNLQSIYTRNKVRLELIPFISHNFNINIVESINRMADLIRDDYSYMDLTADEEYRRCLLYDKNGDEGNYIKNVKNMVNLDIRRIRSLHNAIRRRVIRKAVYSVRGNLKCIESIHIDKILELCLDGRTGAEIHLPFGIRAAKSYDILKIYVNNNYKNELNNPDIKTIENPDDLEPGSFRYKAILPGVAYMASLNASLEATILNRETFDEIFNIEKFRNMGYNSLVQFFDYEKLKEGAEVTVRSREKGDVIKPLKSTGTKKLKEYMIDRKIPAEKRDLIPLLAKDNEIIWVVGYRISDKFKVTENTKSILKVKYKLLK